MKNNRFNHNNDDDSLPEDIFSNDDDSTDYGDEIEEAGYDEGGIDQVMELDWRHLNQKILFRTIKSLQASWFWKFRSEKSKRRMIADAYYDNQQLIARGAFEFFDYSGEE